MSKKKEKPFKRKEIKQEKEHPLENICTEEQLAVLRKYVAAGAAFVCSGSIYSPIPLFLKGLRMEMKDPTSNGVATYDTHVVFKENWQRLLVILTLNDNGNANILHSVKEVKNGRIYSRYVYSVPETQP